MALQSGVIKNGSLVPKNEWISYISGLENNFDDLETNKERAKRNFSEKFVNAVKSRAKGRFAVLLSGGVDSALIALICRQLGCDFQCYTLGIGNSKDGAAAERVAMEYGLKLKKITISQDELETVFLKILKVIGEPDVVKVEVGAVLYVLLAQVTKDGINNVFGGLGSEEIFAGYQRHEEALKKGFEALHKECWSGLKGMWERDLVRDSKVSGMFKVNLLTPFLDRDVIVSAMNIHPMYKIDGENKKIILREVAEDIGLKHEFAWRKKMAAQYGSNVDDALERIARKKGMKKKEFLISSLHV
ncbi:MAG TPA: asparagine synthase-related protein [Candidatus Nanoarchaeia archaeon]|nr:asparagine synthase-related protein [Candidatus Nanoarchaeia archaeon]